MSLVGYTQSTRVEFMIRFRLKEMLAEKGFQENRRVTLDEVSKATGIHRTTLSKIANQRGYNTGTEQVDRLCAYFGCRVEEIIEYVPMSEQPE
ncbi:helix-turn-helix domain-containing protein [Vreelandella jeotgali]|uniref:helix-turn-helix domain-containing protein n=1 Tax=Vreelandella jeotgali TaxID=553386 RepID=UPI001C3F2D34|nr:helix-turn-helix transcriptional regulator [Halomonas jeotgali]